MDANRNVFVAEGNGRVLKLQTMGVNFYTVAVGASGPVQTLTFMFDTAGTIGAPLVLMQGTAGLDFILQTPVREPARQTGPLMSTALVISARWT